MCPSGKIDHPNGSCCLQFCFRRHSGTFGLETDPGRVSHVLTFRLGLGAEQMQYGHGADAFKSRFRLLICDTHAYRMQLDTS